MTTKTIESPIGQYTISDQPPLGAWSESEILRMTEFARGYVSAGPTLLAGVDVDEWVTFAEDIDIHFKNNWDESTPKFGSIEAWAYRRRERPEIGDRDCTDELKLVFTPAEMSNGPDDEA